MCLFTSVVSAGTFKQKSAFDFNLQRCVSVKGTLTDAGAQVSVFSVAPVVVGIAVVAAQRLQFDLLDLHGLCDGCVGSCCRRRCQAWGDKVEQTKRL